MKSNKVFIATSLDGFIADKKGEIGWLERVPNPQGLDFGYKEFIADIDAIVMGRVTYETVCSFDIPWHYEKPVFVLSSSLSSLSKELSGKVFLKNGSLADILDQIHTKGYHRIYIDGGSTIQNFLKENLIDELIITTIPILLGGGFSLFSDLEQPLKLKLIKSKVYLNEIVQNQYQVLN